MPIAGGVSAAATNMKAIYITLHSTYRAKQILLDYRQICLKRPHTQYKQRLWRWILWRPPKNVNISKMAERFINLTSGRYEVCFPLQSVTLMSCKVSNLSCNIFCVGNGKRKSGDTDLRGAELSGVFVWYFAYWWLSSRLPAIRHLYHILNSVRCHSYHGETLSCAAMCWLSPRTQN